ncbi:hypothetical protein JHK82_035287 [Glycine max]|nr:hypothetical protein JHK82_035287 [Glycine max]
MDRKTAFCGTNLVFAGHLKLHGHVKLTIEAERISVDHFAYLKPSDGGSAATQSDLQQRPLSPEMAIFYITQDTQRHPLLPELKSGSQRALALESVLSKH